MYRCGDCGSIFDEPDIREERGCYEDDCGVFSMFESHNYYFREIEVCPDCGSEFIFSYCEEEDELDEYYEE